MTTPTTRKKGAQPGNTNALKHGFYSPTFTDPEARDLQTITSPDLSDEIAMLRVSLRRVFDLVGQATEPGEALQALSVLGKSATQLAKLLKDQRLLDGSGSVDIAAALNEALKETIKEFGCEK